MAFRAPAKRPGNLTELSPFDVTGTAEIMEHRFDLERDPVVVFVAGIAGIITGVVLIIVVTQNAFFIGMVEVFESDRQHIRRPYHVSAQHCAAAHEHQSGGGES